MKLLLDLAKKNLSSSKESVGVYFVNSVSKDNVSLSTGDKTLKEKAQDYAKQGLFCGSKNETLFLRETNCNGFSHILLVGLGDKKDLCPESVRQGAAAAWRGLKQNKCKSAGVCFDSVSLKNNTGAMQALSEGFHLAAYDFCELKNQKNTKKNKKTLSIQIYSKSQTKSLKSAFEAGVITAEGVNFSRRLGDMPGNLMTPTILSEETLKAAKGVTKLKVSVWNKARIQKEKMNSFLSVSLGSAQEPKMIIMEYNGAAASKKPLAYVGKGLTFDCGGISIKPSAGMDEMKFDMCGGANVIGAVLTMARLKLKVNVRAYIPASENMPGAAANKPGDIVTARNGKTIEVNNTDAEGRLILADALVYACEQKPQMIVDAATLTGAMLVALGNCHTGFYTRDNKLAAKIKKAATQSEEPVWHMPLVDHHVSDMKGYYADLSNISSSRGAGSATAAGFLSEFVDKDIPWAHFDIAGTAWNTGNRLNYTPKKGATGAIVRTFVELAKTFTA